MYGFRMKRGLANKTPQLACGHKQVAAHDVVQQQQFEYAGRPTPICLALFARQPVQQRPSLPPALI